MVRSVLFGIGGAVLAAGLWIVVAFVLPMYLPYLIARWRGTGGMSAAYITSGSVLLAAVTGFILAFAWSWYRLR